MTKLVYLKNGLSTFSKNYVDSCFNKLSSSRSNCNFDIPSDFRYRDYLYRLGSVIDEYAKEIDRIGLTIQKMDNIYNDLSSELANNVNKIENFELKERQRILF